jgi:exodeoxyribonuclease V alpha subunit
MTQNDYERQLFNGEQGLVLPVDRSSFDEPVPMAVFPGLEGYRAYHLGPLRSRLKHAFALTVHKSQGSEYGCVGVLLPEYEVPLMTRELLYTAVTRARDSVVFFGNSESLRAGAQARDERNSGLVSRLRRN